MRSIKDLTEQCNYLEKELKSEIDDLRCYIDDVECELNDMLTEGKTVDDFKAAIRKLLGKEEVILKNKNGDLFKLSIENCEFDEDGEDKEEN